MGGLMRAARWVLWSWAVIITLIGISHVLVGTTSILGAGDPNATIDTEMRFAGALCIGYGAAYAWALRSPDAPKALLPALAVITLTGSVGRAISLATVGAPHWFYGYVALPGEIVVVVLTVVCAGWEPRDAAPGRAAGRSSCRSPSRTHVE
jgi:hypothetical protein